MFVLFFQSAETIRQRMRKSARDHRTATRGKGKGTPLPSQANTFGATQTNGAIPAGPVTLDKRGSRA
ncbi:hypothetical protein [Hallella colorans]|uniref:hypothetical protein n=1 Tax=Hallella colorans TaxID=1703337 RepID=UPI0023F2FAEF|nr:hypothetical protein [Hallella colorans]